MTLEIVEYMPNKTNKKRFKVVGWVREGMHFIEVYPKMRVEGEQYCGAATVIYNDRIISRYNMTPFGFGVIQEAK